MKAVRIGLTGPIGSGKSYVAAMVLKMGYPIYSSDAQAHRLIHENSRLRTKIIDLLGSEAYLENGTYNRQWVANRVFSNSRLLEELNAIVHPAVLDDFARWADIQNTPIVFMESALLPIVPWQGVLDRIWVVTAELSTRISRVMKRDGIPRKAVEKRIEAQPSEAEFLEIADMVIRNDNKQDVQVLLEKALNTLISTL